MLIIRMRAHLIMKRKGRGLSISSFFLILQLAPRMHRLEADSLSTGLQAFMLASSAFEHCSSYVKTS